jgi:hypothetical protein
MRGFLAVFEREVAERRLLAVAALAFGLIAVAVPLVPGLHKGGLTPSDVRGGVALGFALLLSTLTAVFLGGSVLVSDLLERRMGFYFARPLSGWALWLGKTAAALVLIFGAGLLVLLPALLLGSNFDAGGLGGFNGVGQLMSGAETFTVWAFGLLLVFFATNALILMVRSRSPWVALDVAALVLVVAMVWLARNRLLMAGVGIGSKNWWAGSLDVFTWLGNALVLATLGAFVAAGAGQVVRGRTDVRRAHRAVSSILWGTLIVVGIAFQALTLWWVRVSPSDLMGVTQIAAVPEGSSWIAFAGPAAHRPGYSPAFFYDVASGRSIPANMGPFSPWWGMPVRISADGRWAVWPVFQGISSQSPAVFHRLDLKSPGAEPQPTRISFLGLPEGFALSPDGRRIAIATRRRLTVEDLDTGRLLASAAYEGELWFSRLTFAGPDRVRLYQSRENWHPDDVRSTRFDIFELDLKTGKLERTGAISGVRGLTGWSLSRDGGRALLRNRRQLQLLDARTGELLADFGEGAFASFLDGGRIALVSPGELRILARDGVQELRRFHFQGVRTVVPVDQPGRDSLRVVTSRSGEPKDSWDVRVLDLRTGAVRSLGTRKLVPLNPPKGAEARLSLEGGQGVIWKEPYSLRWRVMLRDSGAV